MMNVATKLKITIHRVIPAVGGATLVDFEELQALAQLAYDSKIEVVMTVGHRKGWDAGAREMSNSEGAMQGFRLRGSDHLSYHLADIMRCVEAGDRGFLVYDEGGLSICNQKGEE